MTVEMSMIHCAACSNVFAVTQFFERLRHQDHMQFFCPAGHPQFFPEKSNEDRLKEMLNIERVSKDRAYAREKFALSQMSTMKKQLAKLKKKALPKEA